MYCKYCGKEIDDDSIFCRHCGKRVVNIIETTDSPVMAETTELPEVADSHEPALEEAPVEEDPQEGVQQGEVLQEEALEEEESEEETLEEEESQEEIPQRHIPIDTKIDNLPLANREKKIMKRLGLTTIGDVLNYGLERLSKQPKFGKKCFYNLSKVLANVSPMRKEKIDVKIDELEEKAYEDAITLFPNHQDAIRDVCPNAKKIDESIFKPDSNKLCVYEKYSKTTNLAIRHFYVEYLSRLLVLLDENLYVDTPTYTFFSDMKKKVDEVADEFTLLDEIDYFSRKDIRDYIQLRYEIFISDGESLSTRTCNVCRKYKSVRFLVSMIEKDGKSPLSLLYPMGWKTGDELARFYNQKLKPFIEKVLKMDEREVRWDVLGIKYPFLQPHELEFVVDFENEHGYLPIFFILRSYVCHSGRKENDIINWAVGFEGAPMDRKEVAIKAELTPERVRQIVTEGIFFGKKDRKDEYYIELVANNIHAYESLFSLPYITPCSDAYRAIVESEHISDNFDAFAKVVESIVSVAKELTTVSDVFKHTFVQCQLEGELKLLIDTTNINPNIVSMLCLLNDMCNERRKDTQIVTREMLWKESIDDNTWKLLCDIAQKCFNLETTNESIVLSPNKLDVGRELYNILEENGRPMKLEDMFQTLKTKFPDIKVSSEESIRHYLYDNEGIVHLGNTATYALKKWGLFSGTIRDKIREILFSADQPLSIEDIEEEVNKAFPSTNQTSLLSSMRDDKAHFVEMQGTRFGLVDKNYSEEHSVRVPAKRFTAAQQLEAFVKFVGENHRYPFADGEYREPSLHKWLYNVKNGKVAISPTQLQELEALELHCEKMGYPRNKTENNFLNRCNEYRDYYSSHGDHPAHKIMPELYSWYRKALASYTNYDDHRQTYFRKLQDDISSLTPAVSTSAEG